jgi:toxin ParE1/3/4
VKSQISIREGAERDLAKAWRWYEDQSVGLGDKFIAAVREAVVDLQTAADRQGEYYRGFRRVLLRPFPYKVFYRIERDHVIIFRVLHASREHRQLL